jgi:methylmalonyl-CoA mutase cobalamin-binding subunit
MADTIKSAGEDVEISDDKVKADQAAADAQAKVQEAVVAAVAKAHEKELPKLGGPLREPGLGR